MLPEAKMMSRVGSKLGTGAAALLMYVYVILPSSLLYTNANSTWGLMTIIIMCI